MLDKRLRLIFAPRRPIHNKYPVSSYLLRCTSGAICSVLIPWLAGCILCFSFLTASVCTVLFCSSVFFSPVSMDLLYSVCSLASQSPPGKQCLVSLGPGTVLERSQARGATVLQFHHSLMLPQCLASEVV